MSLEENKNVQPPADPVVEDFQPPSDWDRQKESDTLIFMLPGFRKEQLKLQVSSNRVLRLSGERKISENKWRRFQKQEKLSEFHDTSGISAKFEAGMLYIRLPKIVKPQPTTTTTPTQESPKPQEPTTTDDDQKPDVQQHVEDQKETKEDKTEESKTEAQTTLPQEQPKADNEDSQIKEGKAETEAESKTSELANQEMHETTQTALFQELQKELSDHEDSRKKEKGKAETEHGNEMGRTSGTRDDGLSKSSVAKVNKRLDAISGLVEEVKKQNKMINFVALVFLVLLIGIYIKSLVKSSFGGPKNQEF